MAWTLPEIIPIAARGEFATPGSELRRTLAVAIGRPVFTIATWYKSPIVGAMLVNAGITASTQTYFWADGDQILGRLIFTHQDLTSTQYSSVPDLGIDPWPYIDVWVHYVIAVDLTDPDPVRRIRYWIDGIERTVVPDVGRQPPQFNQPIYLGDAIVHTFGNKYDVALTGWARSRTPT